MRVAVIASSLPPVHPGGAEEYVSALADELARDHEVLVLTTADEHRLEGAAVTRLPALPRFDHAWPAAAKALWHLSDQWRPRVFRASLRRLAAFRPDVVHSHDPQGLSAAPFTAVARAGVPHVYTAHDFNVLCARKSLTVDGQRCARVHAPCRVQRRIRGGSLSRHLTRLIAPSDYVRREHVGAGIVPEARSLTIRQGALPGSRRRRVLRPEGPRLGFIGSLSEHKGVLTLLRSFRAVAGEDWSLSLAGRGPLEATVREWAAGDGRIRFEGHVSGDRKDRFYDDLDLLVVPSEWEENAPLVLAEAAVRGLPAIVSDRGGLPETPCARGFPSGDAAALGEAMRWYLASPSRLAETSDALLDRREEFLWETHAKAVEDVLAVASGRCTS